MSFWCRWFLYLAPIIACAYEYSKCPLPFESVLVDTVDDDSQSATYLLQVCLELARPSGASQRRSVQCGYGCCLLPGYQCGIVHDLEAYSLGVPRNASLARRTRGAASPGPLDISWQGPSRLRSQALQATYSSRRPHPQSPLIVTTVTPQPPSSGSSA